MGKRSSAPLQREGQSESSLALQLAALSDAGARGCCSTAAFRAGPAQSLPRKWQSRLQSQASHLDRTLRSGAHIAADAGWSRLPQYSSAHSQMTRKVLTEETGRGEEEGTQLYALATSFILPVPSRQPFPELSGRRAGKQDHHFRDFSTPGKLGPLAPPSCSLPPN